MSFSTVVLSSTVPWSCPGIDPSLGDILETGCEIGSRPVLLFITRVEHGIQQEPHMTHHLRLETTISTGHPTVQISAADRLAGEYSARGNS